VSPGLECPLVVGLDEGQPQAVRVLEGRVRSPNRVSTSDLVTSWSASRSRQ
jgi:hypothetical protein